MRQCERISRILLILPLMLAACEGCGSPAKREILVSAASSLHDVFTELADTLRRDDSTVKITFNFAASNILERQIEQGAPVDVFASASESLMDSLTAKGLIRNQTRKIFAENGLVIISDTSVRMRAGGAAFSLGSRAGERWALASPGVPIRMYAERELKAMGVWERVQAHAIYGANVRQVLDYVASGEARFGIVYGSDAEEFKSKVGIYYRIPLDHPIRYPAAITKNAPNAKDAERFMALLASERGRKVFVRHGFSR